MRVGLDIDGVLAAFGEYFLEYLEFEDRSPSLDWNDPRFVNHFHKVKDDYNFWMNIPVLIDPKELDFIPVMYVTARPIPTEVTKRWLEKKGFPSAPIITVGHNGSKVKSLLNKVDVFVDDAYHNYKELNSNGVKCVLMTRSHNIKYNRVDKRINSLNQVLNYD